MQGWIKLHRKIVDSPIWEDPYYLKLWLYCLMKATHKDREVIIGNQVIKLKPGEFITGRKSLSDDLNTGVKPKLKLNDSTWWRYLNNLEKMQMLHIKKTNKFSIVSIVNWNEYQETEHQMHNRCTSDEHQMHTNKNDKNVKNDKEILKKEEEENPITLYEKNFYPLTPIQMESLWKWVDDFNGNKKVICLAIKETALKNPKVPFRYLERILNDWYRRKLFTVDDVMKEKRRYEQSKIIQYPSNKKRSLFDQGEESRRRQAAAEARAEMIDDNELRKMIEEMPY